jgi:hypothetical protein
MAPVAPLGRDRAIALVKKGKLPVWFGSPHPHVMILEQDGVYRIRELVVDPAEADAAYAAARAAGGPWMPEQHYALGKPTGKIHLEATTAADLAHEMAKLTWPVDW